jgi:hypothetical protein
LPSLAKGDRVLILTSGAVVNAQPIDRGSILWQWIRRLLRAGLHVVLGQAGLGEWRDAVAYRESVLVVAIHPAVPGTITDLLEVVRPAAVFVDATIAVHIRPVIQASGTRSPVAVIGLKSERIMAAPCGLDRLRFVPPLCLVDDENAAPHEPDILLDEVLLQPGDLPPTPPRASMSGSTTVLATARSYAAFKDLILLARLLPYVGFRIVSPWMSRGYEANVTLIDPQNTAKGILDDVDIVVDYARAATGASPLLIEAVLRGTPAATASPAGAGLRDRGLLVIDEPNRLQAWCDAIVTLRQRG